MKTIRKMGVVLSATVPVGLAAFSGAAPAESLKPVRVARANFLVGQSLPATVKAALPAPGERATVLYFFGADCPVTKLYLPRVAQLSARYAAAGVRFVVVNANANETDADSSRALADAKLAAPLVADPSGKIADALSVTRTGDALLFDARGVLRFRGAIDDQYSPGASKPKPNRTFLETALKSVISGKAPTLSTAPVAGCLLDRLSVKTDDAVRTDDAVKTETPAAPPLNPADSALPPAMPSDPPMPKVGPVNFYRDVAPILQARCENCHRPGQIGPFALQTFGQAKKWAAMIGETVKEKRMPPWHSDPHVGTFENDRSLSPKERATLLAWVKSGAPEGNRADAPKPRTFADVWAIGKPDLILTMPEPYKVAATGTLKYQTFRIPTNLKEDTWIQAAEMRPGTRAVVHHVLVFVDDKKGGQPNGLDGQLTAFVPGEVPTIFPKGIARKIPAGSDLIFQVHYTPIGKETVDQTSIGLVFAKEPPKQFADTLGILQLQLRIPPGDAAHRVERRFRIPVEITALSYWPHMHLRGKAFALTAHYPDGRVEPLLSVPKYDFNWQTRYALPTPKKLPAGTEIQMVAWFDNSKGNPFNPAPEKWVGWGEQTDDEMMIGYLDYFVDKNPDLVQSRLRAENFLGGLRQRRQDRLQNR